MVRSVSGAADTSVETTAGLPVLQIEVDRDQIARYGINVADVQRIIEAAVGGAEAGEVIQGNLRLRCGGALAAKVTRQTRKRSAAFWYLRTGASRYLWRNSPIFKVWKARCKSRAKTVNAASSFNRTCADVTSARSSKT